MKSPSTEEPLEGLEESNRRISDLTSLYGTKRQRNMVDFSLLVYLLLSIPCIMKCEMEILMP